MIDNPVFTIQKTSEFYKNSEVFSLGRAIYLGLAMIFFWAGTLTSGRMRSRFLTQ